MSYLPGRTTTAGIPPARVMVQQGIVCLWCDASLAAEKISSGMIQSPKWGTLKPNRHCSERFMSLLMRNLLK